MVRSGQVGNRSPDGGHVHGRFLEPRGILLHSESGTEPTVFGIAQSVFKNILLNLPFSLSI